MRSLTFVRKVFHATVFAVILVSVITIIIVLVTTSNRTDLCGVGDIKKVDDLTVLVQANTIRVSWVYNTKCNVLYNIRHDVDGLTVRNVFRREKFIELNKSTCSDNDITVTVRTVAGVPGEPASKNVEIGHNALGPVQNLAFQNGRIQWQPPVDAQHCDLIYEVAVTTSHGAGEDVVENSTTSNYFELELYPCSVNRIQVTPVISEDRGQRAMLNHTANPAMSAPVHEWTEPSANEAIARWRLHHPEHNACNVVRLSINLNERTIPGYLDPDNTSEVTIDGLNQGINYEYTAMWVLEGNHFSDVSSMKFRTEPLTYPTDLNATEVASHGFSISWNQAYDPTFVKSHRIEIERMNPIHFVPESCPRRKHIHEADVVGDRLEYEFKDASPSHLYRVDLYTIFTVGLERRVLYSYYVNTSEADPGELNLTTEFNFIRGAPYDVTTEITWPVPCDVNGRLRKFTYNITGNIQAGIPDISPCEVSTIKTICVEDDQDSYSISVPDLIPFFEYTIEIQTILEDHSATSEYSFRAPDGYTPPNIET